MYVGCTRRLARRIREQKKQGRKFDYVLSLRLMPTVTHERALALEANWIDVLKPSYNLAGNNRFDGMYRNRRTKPGGE